MLAAPGKGSSDKILRRNQLKRWEWEQERKEGDQIQAPQLRKPVLYSRHPRNISRNRETHYVSLRRPLRPLPTLLEIPGAQLGRVNS